MRWKSASQVSGGRSGVLQRLSELRAPGGDASACRRRRLPLQPRLRGQRRRDEHQQQDEREAEMTGEGLAWGKPVCRTPGESCGANRPASKPCRGAIDICPVRATVGPLSMKSFYITTAIDYVNGSPHIGHAYEKVLTDVIARFRRLMGDPVHFLTGTDEHGQKVQMSARKRGIPAQQFVDEHGGRVSRAVRPAGCLLRRFHPHHRGAAQAGRPRDPAAPLRQGRNLPGGVPRVLQHAPGAVPAGEGPAARRHPGRRSSAR